MTKDELEYERMLKQMSELQKKIADKKALLDKERDEAVIRALTENGVTREQGFKIASLIGDPTCFDVIMDMEPSIAERVIKKRKVKPNEETKAIKESEEKEDEK